MNSYTRFRRTPPLALALAISMAVAPAVHAPGAAAQSYQTAQDQRASTFTQQELDQMLAPIALYPDSLLSQIMMAATYPLEVVEAARWSRAHSNLRGDQAVRAVEDEDWDPSVKSLVAFPQILDMMDEKLDWTERLGDAFLDQESAVMDSVQWLRQKAYAAGTLRSDAQIRVASQGSTIVVENANPQIVYVPYYDPMVVYGPWWWPAYPPVYWAPWPGYYAPPGRSMGFVWGSGIVVSSGFFFGTFDWPHRHARVVHVNNYYYNRTVIRNRDTRVARVVPGNAVVAPGQWRHDPDHRRGVPYRTVSQQQSPRGAAAETPSQARARNAAANPAAQVQPSAPAARARAEANSAVSVPPRVEERAQAQPRDITGQQPNARTDNRRDDRRSANDERQAPRSAGFERQPPSGSASDERRSARGAGGERPYARAPESGRTDAQNAPAIRPGVQPQAVPQAGRAEIRVPDAARHETPGMPSGQAPDMRTRAPAMERHPGATDGRSRDADARASRSAAVEARTIVPAPQPAAQVHAPVQPVSPQASAPQQPAPARQPQASAPRQSDPEAKPAETREARRDSQRRQ